MIGCGASKYPAGLFPPVSPHGEKISSYDVKSKYPAGLFPPVRIKKGSKDVTPVDASKYPAGLFPPVRRSRRKSRDGSVRSV